MKENLIYDLIIVGGGPAGTTLASILKKHRPSSQILIIEKERFPRFHVGETLVSETNRILHEMGVYEKVDSAGFIRKYGATFVWGMDSNPWDMLFGELEQKEDTEEESGQVQTTYAWHVERARYDEILMRHAESIGIEVREETKVRDVLKEGARITGVLLENGEKLISKFVADATGQSQFLGGHKERIHDKRLRNLAYSGYFKGFKLSERLNGNIEASRALIVAHPFGWSWVFPVRNDTLSVGVVTTLEKNAQNKKDPESFLFDAIQSSEQLRNILEGSELVPAYPGAPNVICAADFSYTAKDITLPGFVRVGDSAGFVDPILAVGCFLGQSLARVLAYALNTCLERPEQEAWALNAYSDHVRDTLGAFRELTYFFYRFNERPDAWWAEARRLVNDVSFSRAGSDWQAFLQFATGFAARRSAWREPNALFDTQFFQSFYTEYVNDDIPKDEKRSLKSDDIMRLLGRVDRRFSGVPVEESGKLTQTLRVEISTENSSKESALTRRLHLPPSLGDLFDLVDGKRSLHDLSEDLARTIPVQKEHKEALNRYVRTLMTDLMERGLCEIVEDS